MSGAMRAAVLGYPIAHSLSPWIHSYWLETLGLHGSYTAQQVPPTIDALKAALDSLQQSGYTGCNLTVPLKQMVLQLHRYSASQSVTHIGAANTLVFAGDPQLHNTDVYGVAHCMEELGCASSNQRVLLLGAGGAARAAAAWAQDAGHRLTLAARTISKAQLLCTDMGVTAMVLNARDEEALQSAYAHSDVVIQSTSAELEENAEAIEPLLPKVDLQGKVFMDMVYRKKPVDVALPSTSTRWSRRAAQLGARSEDGLRMLVAQAAQAFQLWTGRAPDIGSTLVQVRRSLAVSAIQ